VPGSAVAAGRDPSIGLKGPDDDVGSSGAAMDDDDVTEALADKGVCVCLEAAAVAAGEGSCFFPLRVSVLLMLPQSVGKLARWWKICRLRMML